MSDEPTHRPTMRPMTPREQIRYWLATGDVPSGFMLTADWLIEEVIVARAIMRVKASGKAWLPSEMAKETAAVRELAYFGWGELIEELWRAADTE